MPFLMSMPTSPSVATMATNPNVLPESIMPKITPMKSSGRHRTMMAGFR